MSNLVSISALAVLIALTACAQGSGARAKRQLNLSDRGVSVTSPSVTEGQIGPLLIRGRSAYQDKIERAIARAQTPPLEDHGLFAFFGTVNKSYLRSQVTDLHLAIIPRLIRELQSKGDAFANKNASPEFAVSFVVTDLHFWQEITPSQVITRNHRAGHGHVNLELEIRHLATNKVEATHVLIGQVEKPESAGVYTVDDLLDEVAQQTGETVVEFMRSLEL
ncbi:MAG: hypothetical protein F4Y91_15270 [Gemmatimonadetes bacterium]|nr:hypothetical protein [Gemmatimonadota bacterium]MXY83381.1 hypothetical protein [Gemmatimonadota bacterium]MYB70151.1 hypothetical protein [Gemmatimonadota bacterium]